MALITPLLHVKGQAAPETKAAVEQAHLLIEQAEALGEPPEDPLLLFVVLYGIWVANAGAFNGDAVRELAAQFLTLAEKQGAPVPLMVGHRIMGVSLMFTGIWSKVAITSIEQSITSIEQSRFMTPVNIVRSLRVSAKTLEPHFWPFDRWPNGCLAMARARPQLPIKRLKLRGIAVKSAR